MEALRRFLIRLLRPVSEVAGKLHIAPHERDIQAHDVMDLEQHLRPGDVILSYTKGEMTNYLIEGEYKHCAMYIGSGEIIEAIRAGVTIRDFEDFCASKDKIAICRPIFCTATESENAAKYARRNYVGRPYDYYFEPGTKLMYCAELIMHAYLCACSGTSPFLPREVMGVKTVLPVDYKLATKKFTVIRERP